MASLQKRMEDCERDLADVKLKVGEMHEEFVDLRGALRTVKNVASLMRVLAYPVAFIIAGIVFVTTGVWKAP